MFPGARTEAADAAYAILGAPLDATTSFQPGTRFGPRQLRHAARAFEDYDHRTETRFTELSVHDHGDIQPGDDVAEYLDYLRSVVREYREQGTVPLVVGGEHTVTVGAVRALDPDIFVCLDAHLDLRESYAGTQWSHATVTHHALKHADEAVVLGARSGSKAEWDRAGEADVTVVEPGAVGSWEPEVSGSVYLSVDIDAADPGYAPGTGTPEPFGLDPRTMHELVRTLAPQAVGFDLVEINDRDDGQAAVLGAKLLRAFVYAHGSA